ncbi:MOSC domain-containing protein [Bacillus siamensis]|uniref:MOSC domain-containing protein n=1 Tax=Bacillus siamensis TaxID=659243 RepID=A0AAI8HLM8_9BACI|nr:MULTISPECIES: MOSC domain-containing protein [Bacillus]AME07675.1 molybdenum cofactor sulfurase [Bacillus sp. SDLI1]AUJ76282.1 MOSC domain-containing protein [Bacillus siamensis]UUA83371.1 MOSC domain-containing protein [Bacillus siamensis]
MWKCITAKAEGVYIVDTEQFVTKKMDKLRAEYGGFPGDLHFGLTKKAGAREPMYQRGTEIFNRRQISIVSMEECDEIAAAMGVSHIFPEWLGANIAISGFSALTPLKEGSRMIFPSGASLLCEGENDPCIQPGEIIQSFYPDQPKLAAAFVRHAMGRRGIVCIVERPGDICTGDSVAIHSYEPKRVKKKIEKV